MVITFNFHIPSLTYPFLTYMPCSTLFRTDPIGGSKLDLGCLFNYFYLFVFFFKSVATQILGPTRMADQNRSPVYYNRLHLSYQNILFMSFHFRVFNYAEAVSTDRPIDIYFYTIRLQNGVSCLYKMIYKTIVQRLTLLFTKCHTSKRMACI